MLKTKRTNLKQTVIKRIKPIPVYMKQSFSGVTFCAVSDQLKFYE
jgi:hypothetical protein